MPLDVVEFFCFRLKMTERVEGFIKWKEFFSCFLFQIVAILYF